MQNVFTDFWIAGKLISAGFSPDRVSAIANPLDYHSSLKPERFLPDRTVQMVPGTGFLLWEVEAEEVINMLNEHGICYAVEEVNAGFTEHLRKKGSKLEIIKIVHQPSPVEYKLVPHANWEAKASPPGNSTLFAFDGNIETRWTSERTQFPGMVFELDMEKVVKISAVELNAERESKDQPVVLELWVSLDGQEWKRVGLWSNSYKFLWTGKHLLLSSNRLPVILYTFSPQSLRYIRLVQKGTDDLHYWSIRELNVYS